MPRKKKENQVEIIDQPDLVKDTTSQAVINNNTSALLNRRAQMNALRIKDQELDDIKKDIKELQALVKKLGKG
tara:strand:- start:1348 stop:1566 length:219 start_codon:yes stop_codon:yes gene_type:complete